MKSTAPTIFDFDACLRRELEPNHGRLGLVQRHKLLYAVLRLSLVNDGEPAFLSRCEPWRYGPVFTELQANPDRGGDRDALSSHDRALCHQVTAKLAGVSGQKLASRSHRVYREWRDIRDGIPANRNCHREIDIDTIRVYLMNFPEPTLKLL